MIKHWMLMVLPFHRFSVPKICPSRVHYPLKEVPGRPPLRLTYLVFHLSNSRTSYTTSATSRMKTVYSMTSRPRPPRRSILFHLFLQRLALALYPLLNYPPTTFTRLALYCSLLLKGPESLL